MLTPEKLVIENCYFFVCIEQSNIPVIKSLIYKGKNLDKTINYSGTDEFFFEDADNACFMPPSKKKKKPIVMDKELLLSLNDLNDLIKYLEDIRDGNRFI